MSKAEAISEIMYSLKFNDRADFEADGISYAIDKGHGHTWVLSASSNGRLIKPQTAYANKTELRQALQGFTEIVQM